MKRIVRLTGPTAVAVVSLIFNIAASANPNLPGPVSQGDPWQPAPFDFVFGNHIDTHVQLALVSINGDPKYVVGSLYIYFTGEVDEASGLPVARHPRGAKHDEECGVDALTCEVGWYIVGAPGAAKYLYHAGVNSMDHPVWMVNRAEEATAPAAGMVIPQPGYFSHFHWITNGSSDPRAAGNMVPAFCDKMSAGMLEMADPTAVNEVCDGWFLQLWAKQDFAFRHGGETIPIRRGADLRSHLNIVTNYQPDLDITPTRVPEGSH